MFTSHLSIRYHWSWTINFVHHIKIISYDLVWIRIQFSCFTRVWVNDIYFCVNEKKVQRSRRRANEPLLIGITFNWFFNSIRFDSHKPSAFTFWLLFVVGVAVVYKINLRSFNHSRKYPQKSLCSFIIILCVCACASVCVFWVESGTSVVNLFVLLLCFLYLFFFSSSSSLVLSLFWFMVVFGSFINVNYNRGKFYRNRFGRGWVEKTWRWRRQW